MLLLTALILGLFSDFNFLLKIFLFIFIIGYVRERITHNLLVLFIVGIISIFVIFFYWEIFGPLYVVYILVTIGATHILVDFFFVMSGVSPKQAMDEKSDSPGNSAQSIAQQREQMAQQDAQRRQQMQAMQGKRPGRPF